MEDVNQPSAGPTGASTPTATTAGNQTPAPATGEPKTPVAPTTPVVDKAKEELIPRSALIAERRKWQQRMRGNQSGRESVHQPSADPNDQAAYVRHLEVQTAEYQLKDGVRKLFKEEYPDLDPRIKKAILNNPLGFLKTGTSKVEDGLLDIQDYVEELLLDSTPATPTTPVTPIQVAGGNTPTDTQPGKTPKDIQEIMNKPITEWTKKDQEAMADFRKSHT